MGSRRLSFSESFNGRFAAFVLVVAVIGLVLVIVLPWITVWEDSNDGTDRATYNVMIDPMENGTTELRNEVKEGYLSWSITGMAGLLCTALIAGIMVPIGLITDCRKEYSSRFVLGIQGCIYSFIGTIVAQSGAVFTGGMLSDMLTRKQLDITDQGAYSIGGAVALITGVILIIMGIYVIRIAYKEVRTKALTFDLLGGEDL